MAVTLNASTSAGLVATPDTSGDIALQNNGTTAVTVSGGNVGIGTSSPPADTNLAVLGNYQTGFYRNVTSGGRGYFINIGAKTSGGFADGAYIFGAVDSGDATGYLTFGTRSSSATAERMRILSGGDVCINRTSSLGSAKLHVTNAAGNANNWVVSLKANATSVDTTMIAFYDGAEDFNGQIYITPASNTTTYGTSSDYRLKENVAPMIGALAKVQALNPVTYTWKKSGLNGQGFIAHELQEIVPECVIGEKDAVDEEGKIMPQMVDTSFLVATLTAAIQELKAELDEAKAEIQALKGVA